MGSCAAHIQSVDSVVFRFNSKFKVQNWPLPCKKNRLFGFAEGKKKRHKKMLTNDCQHFVVTEGIEC